MERTAKEILLDIDSSLSLHDVAGLSPEEISTLFPNPAVSTRELYKLARMASAVVRRRPTDAARNINSGTTLTGKRGPRIIIPTTSMWTQSLRTIAQARAADTFEWEPVLKAIRILGKCPREMASPPKKKPRTNLREKPDNMTLELKSVWLEFQSWWSSAQSYAAAMQLWMDVCRDIGVSTTPPNKRAVGAFATVHCNSDSLKSYYVSLRAILRFCHVGLGALHPNLTKNFVSGLDKSMDHSVRRKKKAISSKQCRELVETLRARGRWNHMALIAADSFVVTRQFALRYQSETLKFRDVKFEKSKDGFWATMRVKRKGESKMKTLHRRCVCSKQHPSLCAVCLLHNGKEQIPAGIFEELNYRSGLWWLQKGAQWCGWQDADAYGTHDFRRGWARECADEAGIASTMRGGGWKSMALWDYLTSKQKCAREGVDFSVSWSSSSRSRTSDGSRSSDSSDSSDESSDVSDESQ